MKLRWRKTSARTKADGQLNNVITGDMSRQTFRIIASSFPSNCTQKRTHVFGNIYRPWAHGIRDGVVGDIVTVEPQ